MGTNAPMGTLDVKGVLNHTQVANVAQITSNSNVVMEYKLSTRDYETEEPRIALTANSDRGYVASASSVLDTTRQPWEAFNGLYGDDVDGWFSQSGYSGTNSAYNGSVQLSSTTSLGEWIKLELPHKLTMTYIKIHASGSTRTVHAPEDFKMYGSNDDINWTEVLSETGAAPTVAGSIYNADTTTTAYKYFALVTTRLVSTTSHCDIGELELYGTPLTANVATGTDVVLHTTPNVPKTDFSNVYYDGQDYTSMPATVADKSGNGVTGTPSGGVGFDSTYKAFTFDGVDDQITATDVGFSGEQTLSMSGWLKTNSSGEVANMGIGTYTAARCMYFSVNNSVNSYYIICNAHNNTYAGTFSPNTWIHVSIVYLGGNISGATLLLYINGELQGPSVGAADTTPLNLPSPCPLNLGKTFAGGNPYNAGSIANFRLYNRALSADEIWELYAYQKEYFGVSPDVVTLKAGRLGIGTSEPRAVLDVRGDIRGGCPVFFQAHASHPSTATTLNAPVNPIPFNKIVHNKGGGLQPSGVFTCPLAGYYYVAWWLMSKVNNQETYTWLSVNGTDNLDGTSQSRISGYSGATGSQYNQVVAGGTVYLNLGDELRFVFGGANYMYIAQTPHNSFTGFYISS